MEKFDINGKREESIDERVIDRLAMEYIKNKKDPLVRISAYNGFRAGLRVGYRIAKEL